MKEIAFLNNNVERWKSFEKIISSPNNTDPDDIAEMFIKITDDLSYAQTYYPRSETERYLNTLALKLHRFIYKTKKERKGKFARFWKYNFPIEFHKARRYVLYSTIIFMTAALIGAISAANDSDFVRLILGDSYVNTTLDNIDKGEPMDIYSSMDSLSMFLYIAQNNLFVAVRTFLFGLFTSFGTALILIYNGIMLGSFQYFFFEQNVLYESVLSIWIHGTIEIFSIIVAGASGILLGNSILFPGTYSRKKSFIRGARRSAKIILGLFPFIIFAALLEGFVTRHTEWPDVYRIAIIAASFIFILWYFFYYPRKLLRRNIEFEII
ncbi:MAG: stage II sporulation protein M [bacterium]|nr:stage II sporulation protein M [bacterium]